MIKVLVISTYLISLNLFASIESETCYKDLSKDIAKNRSAILCQGVANATHQESVLECYKKFNNLKVERTRSAILCHKAFSTKTIEARVSCYTKNTSEIAYHRVANLCAGIKSEEEIGPVITCYNNLKLEINKERAALLCSKSPIGSWVLLKDLYN